MLNSAADRHGVKRAIVHAVADAESRKKCGAKNGQYLGIMQVGGSAARQVGVPYPFKTCADEIEAGVRYLKLALDRGGSECNGISLDQAGLGKKPFCSKYGRRVLKAAKENPHG